MHAPVPPFHHKFSSMTHQVHVTGIWMYLLVWGVDVFKSFTTLSGLVALLTFIFGDIVK